MKEPSTNNLNIYEFHIAKQIRQKYNFDESLFSLTGNVVFANFYQVRLFVQKINEKRNVEDHLSPGEVNAAGLLDEIYHIAIKNYFKNFFPEAFPVAMENLAKHLGEKKFDDLLLEFINVFPPKQVYKNEITPIKYLNNFTENISNKEILVEELILLHLANRNPAFHKMKELFNEEYLPDRTSFKFALKKLETIFKTEDYKFGVNNNNLFDFLSKPFLIHSNSLWDQLEFIKNEWGIFIDEKLFEKIQSSKDLFTENIQFTQHFGGAGGAPTIVPRYKGKSINADQLVLGKSHYKYADESTKEYEEAEQFTPDTNWMPNLVLIAKNIYVWLDQLSKKYQSEIRRLDQIPIEEFELLRKTNINGLWLIGIWERSSASKRIKHLMGNIDAVASAYSLYDYEIAHDLGGEDAYNIFNENAKRNGIRLASDMVPNHTGIYSNWMIEHPEYFIQLDYPPFPNYSFTGTNLSEHPDLEIRLEDQYWEMKDAAVVFERKDLRTGEIKYFYHGNDGTNMPWNDTAQLNLMKEEVREALIQKIFDVARKFSVIRFDAAMTLAKKHFARLWFPQPGKGGDIPSRADYAMSKREFDRHFPQEFWREVVDRINSEMPETLLLAEAFWLMEGYFVRTLGMHRVYNSAFMNMMMNEENQKYRELITNTLEFEPEILKRYVNFMSNPDEETAIDQFGTDDKYFGVLVMMCTLPGLPMFAHGQIEGFTEKYGMEYKRAYYDEYPNQWLIDRHEREIFPILKRRYIFSEVQNYWLYDFMDQAGNVNENVFVYSNEFEGQIGLVIFNNNYHRSTGSIYFSRQKLIGNSSNSNSLHNTIVAKALGINNSDLHFYLFKDITSGLEYIFNGKDLHNDGLIATLNGFEYRVFLNIEEIYDVSGIYYQYYKNNFGKGNQNIKNDINNIKLDPIHDSLLVLFSDKNIKNYFNISRGKRTSKKNVELLYKSILSEFIQLLRNIRSFYDYHFDIIEIHENFLNQIKNNSLTAMFVKRELTKSKIKSEKEIFNLFSLKKNQDKFLILLIFTAVVNIKKIFNEDSLKNNSISDLKLTIPIRSFLSRYYTEDGEITRQMLLINILLEFEDSFCGLINIPEDFMKVKSQKKAYEYILESKKEILERFINNEFVSSYIDVNEYEDKIYFSKERFEELTETIDIYVFLKYFELYQTDEKISAKEKNNHLRFLKKTYLIKTYLTNSSEKSKYLLNELLRNLKLEKKVK